MRFAFVSEPEVSVSQPLRIAFWGQASSGKTCLLARYYSYINDKGPLIDLKPANKAAKLVVDQSKKMKVGEETPATTEHMRSHQYSFFCCRDNSEDELLPLEWIDYPGIFWQFSNPPDQDTINARAELMKSVCAANVVFLLVDPKVWLVEGSKYLRSLLSSFAQEINLLKKTAQIPVEFKQLDQFVITLAKSDVITQQYADFTAKQFKQELEKEAGAELEKLWGEIGADADERRYLLLSGLKVNDNKIITSLNSVGLDAIAPLAFMAAMATITKQKRKSGAGWTAGGWTAYGVNALIVGFAVVTNPVGWVLGIAGLLQLSVLGFKHLADHSRDKATALAEVTDKLTKDLANAEEMLRSRPYYWDSKCQ